tara:strand:- start:16 stop:378 length:363 start_codon:yes stop_codon:yes gene_type:complete
MRLFIFALALQSLFAFQGYLDSDSSSKDESQKLFTYHKPASLTANSINHYSVIHFIQYCALSLIKFIQIKHVLIISVLWEIYELFTHYEWGRESWLNKLCDIGFNVSGFYFGRMLIRKYR